jgi:hypothetical protein
MYDIVMPGTNNNCAQSSVELSRVSAIRSKASLSFRMEPPRGFSRQVSDEAPQLHTWACRQLNTLGDVKMGIFVVAWSRTAILLMSRAKWICVDVRRFRILFVVHSKAVEWFFMLLTEVYNVSTALLQLLLCWSVQYISSLCILQLGSTEA